VSERPHSRPQNTAPVPINDRVRFGARLRELADRVERGDRLVVHYAWVDESRLGGDWGGKANLFDMLALIGLLDVCRLEMVEHSAAVDDEEGEAPTDPEQEDET